MERRCNGNHPAHQELHKNKEGSNAERPGTWGFHVLAAGKIRQRIECTVSNPALHNQNVALCKERVDKGRKFLALVYGNDADNVKGKFQQRKEKHVAEHHVLLRLQAGLREKYMTDNEDNNESCQLKLDTI